MKRPLLIILTTLTPLPAFAGGPTSPSVPVLPTDTSWAMTALWVVAAMFAIAALLGPLIRAGMPDEILPTHSHDEPPGSSHHHGPTGTVDFVAPDHDHR